jgi:polyisoprenoid-binding protein YceI
MPISPGTYTLSSDDDATLTVRTGRTGAASKAGHDLVLEVTSWSASLDLDSAGEPAIALTADARSLRVREGTGGMTALDDDDKANIEQTIDDEVLEGGTIEFRSNRVEPAADGGRVRVEGDLDLRGARRPVAFDLDVGDDGHVTGSATLRQTDWGMKPYSALFGTLKVADEVEVVIDARLPAGQAVHRESNARRTSG